MVLVVGDGSQIGGEAMSSDDKADDDSPVEPKDYSADLLKETLTNWRDAESQLKKTITLIVILVAVFELLTRGKGVAITFSFVRVTDLKLVETYIPVVLAYLTYSLYSLFGDIDYYDMQASRLLKGLSRDAEAEFLVVPPNSVLYSTFNISSRRDRVGGVEAWLFILGFLKWTGVMAGPLAVEVYAFVRLAEKYGTSLAYWLSVALSAVLCVMAVSTIIVTLRGQGHVRSLATDFFRGFVEGWTGAGKEPKK
jgi:hypothetical protein